MIAVCIIWVTLELMCSRLQKSLLPFRLSKLIMRGNNQGNYQAKSQTKIDNRMHKYM